MANIDPAIDSGRDGSLVVWTSILSGLQRFALRARALDGAGSATLGEFVIDTLDATTPPSGVMEVVAVFAHDDAPNFTVVWRNGRSVFAAVADDRGLRDVPTLVAEFAIDPRAIRSADGDEILVAYQPLVCTAGSRCPTLVAQTLDATTLARSQPAFTLVGDGFPRMEFDVAARTEGGYTVVWTDRVDVRILARNVRADGALLSRPVVIAPGRAFRVRAAALGDRVLVAWTTAGVPRSQIQVLVRSLIAIPECGNVVRDGVISTSDALQVLIGAVGGGACVPSVCDTGLPRGVDSTDALRVLRAAVGLSGDLLCSLADG